MFLFEGGTRSTRLGCAWLTLLIQNEAGWERRSRRRSRKVCSLLKNEKKEGLKLRMGVFKALIIRVEIPFLGSHFLINTRQTISLLFEINRFMT